MKNKRFGLILPVLAGLLLCSCSNPAGERHEGAPGPGNTLTIRFDGVAASRSIRPAPLSGDVSWFNISLTRSGFTTIEQTIAGTDASGTLTGIAAGDWLLDIAGYNPSAACIASHSQTVTISDGANAVPVVLVRKRTGGPDWGYGTMQVTLTVYSLPVPAAYCAVTLCSLPDLSPVDVASSLTVYDNESSDVFDILATLPSRDYLFQVSYEYGGLTWYLVDDPVVKIYDDAVSSAQLYKTAMTPAVLPAANGMAFTGAPADFAGKKFIYVVVDKDTADAVLLAGGSFTDILPASGGAFTLGPDGFGTEVPVDLIGLAEVPLVPGSSYYVSAMVDMNGNYSSLGAADILADYAYILPHDGDYVTASDNGFALYAADAANGSITLTPADFSQYSGGVFFVADAASGDASGSTPANACTLATAATGVAVLSLSGKQAEICLTENVNLSTGIGINGSAIIRSVIPGSAATIVVSGTYGGSYIDVGSGASLRLVNVTVDASSVTLLESSLVTVNTSGELELGEDATISNANSASNGGAVCLAGGSLILSGGTIAGCSAPKGAASTSPREARSKFRPRARLPATRRQAAPAAASTSMQGRPSAILRTLLHPRSPGTRDRTRRQTTSMTRTHASTSRSPSRAGETPCLRPAIRGICTPTRTSRYRWTAHSIHGNGGWTTP